MLRLQYEFERARVIWLSVEVFCVIEQVFFLVFLRTNDVNFELRTGFQGFHSSSGTVQRKLLQDFGRPTETVFCQEPGGGEEFKTFSERRESREDAAEGFRLQEQNPGRCAFR